MANCEFLTKCPFFNNKLKNMPTAADTMKNIYCRWNFIKCARYKVAIVLGSEEVPSNLFPRDTVRAEKILAQLSQK